MAPTLARWVDLLNELTRFRVDFPLLAGQPKVRVERGDDFFFFLGKLLLFTTYSAIEFRKISAFSSAVGSIEGNTFSIPRRTSLNFCTARCLERVRRISWP